MISAEILWIPAALIPLSLAVGSVFASQGRRSRAALLLAGGGLAGAIGVGWSFLWMYWEYLGPGATDGSVGAWLTRITRSGRGFPLMFILVNGLTVCIGAIRVLMWVKCKRGDAA